MAIAALCGLVSLALFLAAAADTVRLRSSPGPDTISTPGREQVQAQVQPQRNRLDGGNLSQPERLPAPPRPPVPHRSSGSEHSAIGHAAVAPLPAPDSTPSRPTSPATSKGRVAICFFGLTRSLTITHEAIRRNLVDPILKAGYQVDTFLHTYTIKTMDNVWSDERDVQLNTTEWVLLQPRDTAFTDQQLFLDTNQEGMRKCRERGHAWPFFAKTDFTIVDNLFLQLNSISEVNELWYKAHEETPFHAVMFARPDVLFNCPFNATYLDYLQPEALYIPDHSHYRGMNDRFAMGPPRIAYEYGRRIQFALENCPEVPIHAEYYAKLWVDALNLKVVFMPQFFFFRVRVTGVIAPGDAMTQKGCNLTEIYEYPIQPDYVDTIRKQRRNHFKESEGWAKYPPKPNATLPALAAAPA